MRLAILIVELVIVRFVIQLQKTCFSSPLTEIVIYESVFPLAKASLQEVNITSNIKNLKLKSYSLLLSAGASVYAFSPLPLIK